MDEGAFVAHLVAVVGRRKHCRPTCQRGRDETERASEKERKREASETEKERREDEQEREKERKIEERGREGGGERDYCILVYC